MTYVFGVLIKVHRKSDSVIDGMRHNIKNHDDLGCFLSKIFVIFWTKILGNDKPMEWKLRG